MKKFKIETNRENCWYRVRGDLSITICSIVERKVGVYKEIVEGDNNL